MQSGPFSISTDGSNDRGRKEKVYPVVVNRIADGLIKNETLALVDCHVPTRWLSLEQTATWVLEQWYPLLDFFKKQTDTDSQEAVENAATKGHKNKAML
ncbi:uncharacterized protein LOC141915191 [Tubulanus polymorphus]|uniref:uncharacterized protein LOC141915191 n=1 Tax=Tubulanus polymorphus TaxID=672921 RepID=UPI003DA585E6